MFALPFIDSNGAPQKFGTEFDHIYDIELKNNLIIPNAPVIDYNTGKKYTLYDTTDGIYNQARLFENNDNPQEDQQITDQQALSRIRKESSSNRELTESEKRYQLYTTDNFDIRFRGQLMAESLKRGDNIFSEFSQDHVNAVRTANTNLINEENLYTTPADRQANFLSSLSGMTGDMFLNKNVLNQALGGLMAEAKREQTAQEEAQKFRDRQMPKTSATLGEKFDIRMKGRPLFTPGPPMPPQIRTRSYVPPVPVKKPRPLKDEL